ncbi:MAG TPA: dihydroorotase, partial [Bacteroidales bacterium]|nr:dihydroorotase [Bacteroidales bacterium]
MTYLFKNATLVNEGNLTQASVFVSEGKIQSIITGDKLPPADEVIDATDQFLMPGIIDDQVHFRQPGMEHKADIRSESRAAAAGGITSFMEMPNTNPATTSMERLKEKQAIAEKDSLVNYAFYLGATPDNLKEIEALDPKVVAGLKVFMGSSTGNLLVNQREALERIFQASPVLIATHCEDDSIINTNLSIYKDKYGDDIPLKYHPAIRSAEACYASTSLAVELASKHNADLHVLHLSTADELELFSSGPVDQKKITAEACVHHLWFSDADYAKKGTRIKWNPAIKSEADRNALRGGLLAKKLDIVATDHAPHLMKEKNQPYAKAPSGGPLVQHSLLAMLELGTKGIIGLPEIVEKMAHNPAIRFKIDKRGFIREGYYADLVLVDPMNHTQVEKDTLLYKCGWSPFEGETFRHRIAKTMVNGKIV